MPGCRSRPGDQVAHQAPCPVGAKNPNADPTPSSPGTHPQTPPINPAPTPAECRQPGIPLLTAKRSSSVSYPSRASSAAPFVAGDGPGATSFPLLAGAALVSPMVSAVPKSRALLRSHLNQSPTSNAQRPTGRLFGCLFPTSATFSSLASSWSEPCLDHFFSPPPEEGFRDPRIPSHHAPARSRARLGD